jgi:hypothetical protein
MRTDGDYQAIDKKRRAPHDVDVTVGDGVEASGIKADAHTPLQSAKAVSLVEGRDCRVA